MSWLDDLRAPRPSPPEAGPSLRRLGAVRGQLCTMTAAYDLVWRDGTFRILRRFALASSPPVYSPVPVLICRFDMARYPALTPALLDIWAATEWLYFLEDALPLYPLA